MIGRERLETLFDDNDTIGVVEQLLAEAWEEGAQAGATGAFPDGATTLRRNPYVGEAR